MSIRTCALESKAFAALKDVYDDRERVAAQWRVEGSYFIKEALEKAGYPVLIFKADPVDARKWNADTMTGLVDDFIEQRVIPNKEKKLQD